ncbi:MAG: ATPase domain-containing protein [Halovenus sp.]
MTDIISTGIEKIDRELSGGIEVGSIFAINAGPAMQSEALFQPMMQQQPTLYLTTLRDPTSVSESLEALDQELEVKDLRNRQHIGNDFVEQITGSRTETFTPSNDDQPLENFYEAVEGIDQQVTVVVDPVNPLEQTENRTLYREVLNELKLALLDTGSIGILHCHLLDGAPPLRDVTLAMSDVVMDLDLVSEKRQKQYQVTIPKNRGGEPLLEESNIVIDSEVWVDESRNI